MPISCEPVTQAVVLAAGNGDRFRHDVSQSKLLASVAGVPLLVRTLRSARRAGIVDVHLVLGYDAARVRAAATANVPEGMTLHFHFNARWREENGRSVLAARSSVDHRPFALLMGDHIFDAAVLRRALRTPTSPTETLLCIDRHTSEPSVVAEATRVRLHDDRITAIGKSLVPFHALDTGLFVCHETLFGALEESCTSGDSTLTGGVARLAAKGLVRGLDPGRSYWCDIDTLADLRAAEEIVDRAPEV